MSTRDQRYHFPVVEAHLRDGEDIVITTRKRAIAGVVPERPTSPKPPDFAAMLNSIYGKRRAEGDRCWGGGDAARRPLKVEPRIPNQ
jgi:antitoxin (DNA-binding transcriptional repressor) of toxin-antitoxin stability system